MLCGIDPLLTGKLLYHLDTMGHGDLVVISDAHFPALRGPLHRAVQSGTAAVDMIRAIRTVLPIDSPLAGYVMTAPADAEGTISDLRDAARVPADSVAEVGREEFYALAEGAFLTIRTAEARPFGNLILCKGIVRRQVS